MYSIKRRRVLFELRLPEAREVLLALYPNPRRKMLNPMKKDPRGRWRKIRVLDPGRYRYQFVVDGRTLNDTGERLQVSGARMKDSNELDVYVPSTREI